MDFKKCSPAAAFVLTGILMLAGARDLAACGPDLPWPLLAEADLSTRLPARPFLDDLERLDNLPPASFEHRESEDPEIAVERADVAALDRWLESRGADDPELRAGLLKTRRLMRERPGTTLGAAPEPEPPIDVPERLPAELRLYLRGAEAYHRDDFEAAAQQWLNLLELPADERRERTVMAHYMLGRALQQLPGAAEGGSPELGDEAIAHFAEARRFAAEGWRDDLGLAHDSLGWEARVELHRGRITPAIHLYAEQLSAGDPTAATSIRFACARLAQASDDALAEAASNSLVREAYSLYVAAHDFHGEAATRWLDAADASSDELTAAGTLAWVAYQHGRFDDAGRWLKMANADDPFVPWLRSKLAARAGNLDEAQALLEVAARALAQLPDRVLADSPHGYWLWAAAELARAEVGALELERGRYEASLGQLLQAGYWLDAAYLAERVLTLDELQGYVEREWPEGRKSEPTSRWWGGATPFDRDAIAGQIRHLLARRLTRDGRWRDALAFFPHGLRLEASQLTDLRERADNADLSASERAGALWRFAQGLNDSGLPLTGTEVNPDWRLWDGQFDTGAFARADPAPEEAERARRSLPVPDERFHYRYVAADVAWRAAELLPDQAKETAHILFTAGTWLKNVDPGRADRFYKALVRRCGQTPLGREADRQRWFPSEPPGD